MNVEHRSADELIDPVPLRRAFGNYTTGVTVLTVGGERPHGMTANSFTSVSLDPPLVLVCVDRGALMHPTLHRARWFGVSVLAEDQEGLARYFADRTRPTGAAQFDRVGWSPGRATGVPLIDGAVARFECEQWRTYAGGDHTIFVGRLVSAERDDARTGLIFLAGRFRRLAPEANGGGA